MNSKRLAATAPAIAAVLFFSALMAAAATVVVIVYPGNLEGWQTQTTPGATPSPSVPPSVGFVTGPGTPPFSRGSAELRVGSDGDAIAALRQPNFAGTTLPPTPSPTPDPTPEEPPPPRVPPADELTALGYSTYVQSGGSGGQAPYIILSIDNNNDGAEDDLLFFEPVYQNGTYPTVDPSVVIPNQCGQNPACVTPGQWQTWDAFNGGWWSLDAETFGPPLTTLAFYRAQHPNARIVNTAQGQGGVRVVAGGGAPSWNNFVGNVDAFRIGVGVDAEGDPNVTIYDFEPGLPPPGVSSGVLISELRASGPGSVATVAAQPARASGAGKSGAGVARAAGQPKDGIARPAAPPCCDGDEYVELYNTSDTEIAVQSSDGTAGWALVQRGPSCLATPEVIAVIPNGTTIPGRGHYLLVGSEYSLGGYPAGSGTTAEGDQSLSGTLEDDRNVAIFSTTDPGNFSLLTRIDAVGFDAGNGGFCDLLSEGTKLPPPRGSTAEHAYVRRLESGRPRDTNNNAADFWIVSTTPDQPVGDEPSPRLGAPGPEGTTSPIQRNDAVKASLIDPMLTSNDPPNAVRKQGTPDNCPAGVEECNPNRSQFGTFSIRRRFTNTTGVPITRLRFRIVDVTTFTTGETADLRAISSGQVTGVAVTGGGTVTVEGTTLEGPPGQPLGGGFNSTLSADTISLAEPLAPGASINLQFLLGVQQPGFYRFFVNVEAAESSGEPTIRRLSARPAKGGVNKRGAWRQ